MRRRQR
jgi:hypothetical protein